MLTWLRAARARQQAASVTEQRAFYAQGWDSTRIAAWQLDRFNELWSRISVTVPYYRRQKIERNLPSAFSTWEQFDELMPVLNRATMQAAGSGLADTTRPPDYHRTTGGSTSQPVQLPSWREEQQPSTEDIWLARSWHGVSPADRLFLLWGHSHLLGSGWRGRLNGLKRRAKDALCGYHRHSAYDLSDQALRRAGDQLLAVRPAYVLGYAVALDLLAQANADRREAFHRLGLKVVIATAEAFPRAESRSTIAAVLGCPVVMEYGAVETGLIAHEHPAGGYATFWRHHRLAAGPDGEPDGSRELLVTSLFPRCFPLVRYRLGDLVAPAQVPVWQGFSAVIGRCNDSVLAPDGQRIHSEAFTHAVKECSAMRGFQVVQSPGATVELHYMATADLAGPEEQDIRQRLRRIHPALAAIRLVRVASLRQTLAGKTRLVVHEPVSAG